MIHSPLFQAMILTFLCLSPLDVFGQSLKQGVRQYQSGKFEEAEKTLRKFVKAKASSSSLSSAYKYLSLSRFMLGKEKLAVSNMQKAISYNSSLKLRASDFKTQSDYRRFKRIYEQSTSPKKSLARITVKAGGVSGDVIVKGRKVGRLGQTFEWEAGVIEITARAPGYEEKVIRLNAVAKAENVFVIKLKKMRKRPKGKLVDKFMVIPEEDDLSQELKGSPNPNSSGRLKPTQNVYDAVGTSEIYRQDSLGQEMTIPLPQPKAVKKKKKKRRRPKRKRPSSTVSSTSSSNINLLTFMPFGVGQFQNGDNILGAIVGAGQAASLVGFAIATQESDILYTEASETIAAANSSGNIDPANLEQYRTNSESAIQEQEDLKILYLAIFGGLWAGGVTHAILSSTPNLGSSDLSPDHQDPRRFAKDNQNIDLGLVPYRGSLGLAMRYDISF